MTRMTSETETKISGNKGMENLISIVSELMNACSQTGLKWELKLPQIVVVGSQSAGKSSVLESIVGRDFLPRGTGIVTRCPIILHLTNAEKEYGMFSHTKEKRFENFDDIRSEIVEETNFLAGSNKGISEEPINLKIFSPHVLDLTLVDLPGIIKVPIGDTPKDIEAQTKKLIRKYISNENCLILAVSQANNDLAVSEGLNLAGEVDPDHNRTIGVLTKCDLMDTDVRKILDNESFPLKRGYIGVVNRSQEAINNKQSIQAALKHEADFFANHKNLSDIAHRCGTPYLQKALNRELTEHIRKSMPALRKELQIKISELSDEVDEFKNRQSTDPNKMKNLIIMVAKDLAANFCAEMGSLSLDSIETKGLSNGAEINKIFHKLLPKEIETIKYAEEISKNTEILDSINYHYGIYTPVYPPQFAFVKVTKEQISKLKVPITVCINLVIAKLILTVEKCIKKIFYPNLRVRLEEVVIKYITDNKELYKKSVLSIVDIEKSYLNTNQMNLNRKENSTLQEELSARQHLDKSVDNEHHDVVMDIFDKMVLYMTHVKNNMKDIIPKAITYNIIKKLEKYIEDDLLLYVVGIPCEEHPQLLKMEAAEQAKYEKASKMLEACKKAMNSINNLDKKAEAIYAE